MPRGVLVHYIFLFNGARRQKSEDFTLKLGFPFLVENRKV